MIYATDTFTSVLKKLTYLSDDADKPAPRRVGSVSICTSAAFLSKQADRRSDSSHTHRLKAVNVVLGNAWCHPDES